MAKKKQSSGGKANGSFAKGGAPKSQSSKSTPVVRRPPRHQGR